jgi:inner membrane protein
MDSISQAALGAALGEAVAGRKVGRRASLWGAVCGTLPDLDVFIPMGGPVEDFTYHRAESHALFYLALATPLIVWLITRIHPKTREYRRHWAGLVILVFYTHVLLDSFTVYGTQIFLPFSNYPVGWSAIFIIDPLYTIPLLVGVISLLVMKRSADLARRINHAGLIFSTFYLIWSAAMMFYVTGVSKEVLEKENISYQKILAGPTPFNTLFWRTVAITDTGYVEGFYSIFQGGEKMIFDAYASENSLLEPIADAWAVRRLQWFTKGFYRVRNEQGKVVISDLRMGFDPVYFFSFAVGRIQNNQIIPQRAEQVEPAEYDMGESLRKLWRRFSP